MDALLSYAKSRQAQYIAFLQELVECESPSQDPAALKRFGDLFASRITDIAKVRRSGLHMLCEFDLPGPKKKTGQIMGLGHCDTVYPMGTLAKMPFRQSKGRLWGPGVIDMKGGLASFILAMRALRETGTPVKRRVVLQVVADEEIGSRSSRHLIEAEARKSLAVLVVEPGTGLDGICKTSRKGIGGFRLEVHGISAHAGANFTDGANAILELARQIGRIEGFTNLRTGLTVSPGVIAGGLRGNVIPDYARVDVDVRVPTMAAAAALEKKVRALRPIDRRCRLAVNFRIARPPMVRTAAIGELFQKARKIAKDLGVTLQEEGSGGASDGNFTAAVGTPTLDGIGAVGQHQHSPQESLVISRIADRTALLAHLVASL